MKDQADTIGIKAPHEYSTITGIRELVHEILMNLKEIVLRSNLYGTYYASIYIILPPYVEIIDNTQHIAKRNRGYLIKTPHNFQDESYPIDVVFMHVRNVSHSIHSYGNENEKQEIFFIEIWINRSLTPKEVLHEASRILIDLFIPFLHMDEDNLYLQDNQHTVPLSPFTFHDILAKLIKK
ncbi:unnamed protein product [Withania somnifera]